MNLVTCQKLGAALSKNSFVTCFRTFATKLMEVGRLDTPKTLDTYKVGQLFLHRLFGYRGVILLPWYARVFDRDKSIIAELETKAKKTDIIDINDVLNMEDQPTNTRGTYYNNLIDDRDQPFIQSHTSPITIMGYKNKHNRGDLYTIPGLDYTSHEDVMPYTPSPGEDWPFQHQLAKQFLSPQPGHDPPFKPKSVLLDWRQKNHLALEVSEVQRQTTEKICVTVAPFFLGHRESLTEVEFWWRYWICLENKGELAVRLRERHWRIFSETGALKTVQGRGVLGEEPVLSPGLPAFQYTSHVSLLEPSGHMWGSLRMEREDGNVFDCKIPKFCLKSREFRDFE